jgi:hypothetical protein
MKDMTSGELARELLEFFGPEGERWGQGHLFDGQKWCFQGAASLILLGSTQYADTQLTPATEPFAAKVREQYPAFLSQYHPAFRPMALMERFNDNHSWDELRAILEKVATDEP